MQELASVQAPTPEEPSDTHIRALALCAVQAIEGVRPIERLGKWVTGPVLTTLQQQRILRTGKNTLYRDTRQLSAAPGRILLSRAQPSVIDCAVVMHTPGRSFAVTMRFEVIRQAWRATELSVL